MVFAEVVNHSINDIAVNKNELVLKTDLGLMYYQNQPFNGTSVKHYNAVVKAESIKYINGKRHGIYQKWFPNGALSFEAYYVNGLQHGKAKSWWKNGNLRSEANFKDGIVNGIQKQWYKSGAKFKEMSIVNGQEEGFQKAWRENGKIYNNYEAKNGRIFGLKRASLCYQLEDENVQY
ncbi:toxin-antitoxin system YwqK family antitoxin [Psychroserpens ponticola]|uniref:Toxin-antitoxin system YwqK family antitoxin n=1 Tax=Psychroserpens ponticola TaxID=2932268 RepID=A0ABY7RUK7_9FLAO|nr:toxin-antitoxin system YwqK family antitoxin [Psychroserpens ponticola]WCO00648.1 toxin-antitoxin system YwqK family antitoxin [Psychroserpens ponticola]